MHPLRAVVRRARAAQLLVQLAVRRVRALRRARHALRGRPRAGRPRRRPAASPTARSRRGPGSGAATSTACSRRSPRSTASRSTRRGSSWARRREERGPVRHRRARRARPLPQPVRTPALVHTPRFEGVVPWLERRHTESESDRAREQIEGYMREVPCPACGGARLRPASLAVTVGGSNIYEVGELSIRKAAEFLARARAVGTRPDDRRARARRRSTSGCGSCSTSGSTTSTSTASSAHARRRRGAAHPAGVADRQRTRRRALRARRAVDRPAPARQRSGSSTRSIRLRDLGNTVIVVEHDEETIRVADHIVDIGPGRGGARRRDRRRRARSSDVLAEPRSITGQYLPGKRSIAVPEHAPSARATRGSSCATRASTTSRTSTSSSRSAASSPSPA